MDSRAQKVGVVVKTFPKLSETFVLGEVLGLERLGIALEIFALHRPSETLRHDAVEQVRSPINYLQSNILSDVLLCYFDSLLFTALHPVEYIRALWFARKRAEPGAWQDLFLACALARRVQRAGITHLHAHFATQPVAVAEMVSRLTGIPFSISAHAKDIYLSEPPVLARKMANARFSVTCTHYNRRYLASIAAPGSKIFGMYHGINSTRFAPQPRTQHEKAPLILAVGRLREKKGFATLLRACALLQKMGKSFRCEIVGYGEQQAALQQLIAELDLSGTVELKGTMAHGALIERYQSAAIFAAPCQVAADGDRDGIPNVMLEAMAMQLAVVATPVSGIPEVLSDGVNGVIATEEDPRALAEALSRLIDDGALRERLGAAARQTVLQQFDNAKNLLLLRELIFSDGRAMPASLAEESTEKPSYA